MGEELEYVTIPEFDQIQTIKDIYSDDLHRQTNGLYSLTYYSGDFKLILTTLEEFIRSESWETRYTVFQCLSRFLELYREIPIDSFLPYIIEGFDDTNDDVRRNASNCLENLFYCITPNWNYTTSEINKALKSVHSLEMIKAVLFTKFQKWQGEKLNSVIKKCLKHEKDVIQCCGGIMLRLAYSGLHSQLSSIEKSARFAVKLSSNGLKYFNNEVYVLVEWIEEDMNKLKTKLRPKINERKSSR